MDGDEKTLDQKTLGELFIEAGAPEDGELTLSEGDRVRLTVCGGVTVNDVDLNELSSRDVERVARGLREAAGTKHLRPETNPFIKLD